MLQSVSIQNFAIIDQLTVDFNTGMSVLTGETGAGKSIIIDAVSLLAGGRGSASFVRHNQQKAVLQGLFDIENNQHAQQLLESLSIPVEDNQLAVYRELHANGKGIVRLNGILSSVAVLKQVTEGLIDIHGQHEHQQLMDETKHLSLLDRYAKESLQDVKAAYKTAYNQYVVTKKALKSLMLSQAQDDQKVLLLQQHIKDIEAVNPKDGEFEQLRAELKLLIEDERYAKALFVVDNALSNEPDGAIQQLNQSIHSMQLLTDEQSVLKSSELIDALEKIKEVSRFVAESLEKHRFNPERFEFVQTRLNQYDVLNEKYGDVLNYYEVAKKELDAIVNKEKYLSKAQEEFVTARENVLKIGANLSQLRQDVAKQLETVIQQQLNDLYMQSVTFKVVFDVVEKVKITNTGLDVLSFMVSTNAGEPLKPLAKVASGGELSRMMLALKVIFSKAQQIDTLIFDEIDTGVSGRVAQSIAQKMSAISQDVQVLSVSHLPQVAAIADNHLFVSKGVQENHTQTAIKLLNFDERIEEVAKMFAGEVLNDSALEHAKLLLLKKTENQ